MVVTEKFDKTKMDEYVSKHHKSMTGNQMAKMLGCSATLITHSKRRLGLSRKRNANGRNRNPYKVGTTNPLLINPRLNDLEIEDSPVTSIRVSTKSL